MHLVPLIGCLVCYTSNVWGFDLPSGSANTILAPKTSEMASTAKEDFYGKDYL